MNAAHQIGTALRGARELRQLSIEDVTHLTRIRSNLLKALEVGDYAAFSSPAYAKGFLLQYSEFLGVDAHEALAAFAPPDALFNLAAYDYLKSHSERVVRANLPVAEPEPEVPVGPNYAAISLQAVALVLITAVIVGAVAYTVRTIESRGGPSPIAALRALQKSASEQSTPTVVTEPVVVAGELPDRLMAATPAATRPPDPEAILGNSIPRAIIVREP
jgi:cytoskeletal protein RodZ